MKEFFSSAGSPGLELSLRLHFVGDVQVGDLYSGDDGAPIVLPFELLHPFLPS